VVKRIFCRCLLPHPKLVLTPVDLEPAKDAAEAQAQIGILTSMAARGELDLHALSRALAMAIDTWLAELQELLGERESEAPDALAGPNRFLPGRASSTARTGLFSCRSSATPTSV
jgi:hypothetical protein